MKHADYQSWIAIEARSLRTAAASVDPGTLVPTCPGWTVRRLVQHLGRVFEMVIRVLQAADPQSPPGQVESTPGDAFAIFDHQLSSMLELLAVTDPATPVWHFTPAAPKTAAFWSRRMAHEVTVHRIDVEAAAGINSVVDPDLAADGIDEVLTRWIQRRTDVWAVGTHAGTVLYHAVDAGRAWTVRLVPGRLPQTLAEAVTKPDASVIGLADAVYRAAWGRPSGAVISGESTLVDLSHAR